MKYVTYRGLRAKINCDGTVSEYAFNHKFKSLRAFKMWATKFSKAYLDRGLFQRENKLKEIAPIKGF